MRVFKAMLSKDITSKRREDDKTKRGRKKRRKNLVYTRNCAVPAHHIIPLTEKTSVNPVNI